MRRSLAGASAAALVVLLAYVVVRGSGPLRDWEPREGDVLFQALPRSPLAELIEGVTRSPWSHCGLVARRSGEWVVIEAFGTVSETPLATFVARSREGAIAVHRPAPALAIQVPAILAAARELLGRPYDERFEPGDGAIYCSELVQRAIERATGAVVGRRARLGELDWRPFEAALRAQAGGSVPFERELITPVALAAAPELPFLTGHRSAGGAPTAD